MRIQHCADAHFQESGQAFTPPGAQTVITLRFNTLDFCRRICELDRWNGQVAFQVLEEGLFIDLPGALAV
jgi:hypothetical protein